MTSPVTHSDLGKIHERINAVEASAARSFGKIEAHERLCEERWKNQDGAWERQDVSNEMLKKINDKVTYWSGAIAVLAFILGLAAAWSFR